MRVIRGFSEDTNHNKWAKGEVEATEDDLIALLAEVELPAEAMSKLSAHHKFQLLNALVESCLLEQRVTGGLESATQVLDRLKSFAQMKKSILDQLKAVYVPF